MPTYVYACSSCNTTFEAEQRITEDPLDSCACGSKGTVKRVIQPVGIAFKGSGFHINDYSSNKPPEKSAGKPEDAPIPPEKSSETPPATPATPAPAATPESSA